MSNDLEQPSRGWVFYDGQCGFCSRWLKLWQPTLAKYGFAIAPLQEPWVVARFRLPLDKLVDDLRLLMRDGQTASGADVYLQVARQIWWAWPFYAVFSLPGFHRLIHLGYRWFARNRYHISHTCKLTWGRKESHVPATRSIHRLRTPPASVDDRGHLYR